MFHSKLAIIKPIPGNATNFSAIEYLMGEKCIVFGCLGGKSFWVGNEYIKRENCGTKLF